jgi:hypothetical protein
MKEGATEEFHSDDEHLTLDYWSHKRRRMRWGMRTDNIRYTSKILVAMGAGITESSWRLVCGLDDQGFRVRTLAETGDCFLRHSVKTWSSPSILFEVYTELFSRA